MIQFTIPGQPVAKGRPRAFVRAGKVGMYTPQKTASYENLVALHANQAMCGRDQFTGPVSMSVLAVFDIPRSWLEKKRKAAMLGDILPAVKPDLDNLQKILADALNGIVYRDDAQVCDVSISKRYGFPARVSVSVWEAV